MTRKRKSSKHPLPSPKFTDEERRAWDWLHDCGIRPWLVDLLTKEVRAPGKTFKSIVDFAKSKGMRT